jgi:hypothetical protein
MFFLKGGRFIIGLTIDCTTEDAWQVLTDTQLWPVWGPSVQRVDCEQRRIGPGSSGRIKTSVGFWVPFTITDYQEQKFWAWRIGRFRATGHRLEKRDANSCTVAFDMVWWAAPYLVVCLVALKRIKRLIDAGGDAAIQSDN